MTTVRERPDEHSGPGSGGPGPGTHEEIRIVVNGRPKVVAVPVLAWREVVLLAFDPIPTGPNITITVTYRNAVAPTHSGTLTEGQTVTVHNGTVFNVTITDKS